MPSKTATHLAHDPISTDVESKKHFLYTLDYGFEKIELARQFTKYKQQKNKNKKIGEFKFDPFDQHIEKTDQLGNRT